MRLFQAKKKYSTENATRLCDDLAKIEASAVPMPSELVEALRELAEVMVWGDKHEEAMFDIFLERAVIGYFERVFCSTTLPSSVKVQVIQSLNILLQNLTRPQSIYFILSNNYINHMIKMEIDPSDDELMSNYISFLKTLSLRLNKDTVQFFYLREEATFPMYHSAVRLVASEDRMVRTSVRQVVMNVFQIQEPDIVNFTNRACTEFITSLLSFIATQTRAIDRDLGITKAFNSQPDIDPAALPTIGAFDTRVEDLVDDLYFINDLFAVPQVPIQSALYSQLKTDIIDGVLCNKDVSAPLRFLLLSHWIRVCTHKPLSHELIRRSCCREVVDAPSASIIAALRSTTDIHDYAPVLSCLYNVIHSKLADDEIMQEIGLKASSGTSQPELQKDTLPNELMPPEENDPIHSRLDVPVLDIVTPSDSFPPLLASLLQCLQQQCRNPRLLRLGVLHLTLHLIHEIAVMAAVETARLLPLVEVSLAECQLSVVRRREAYRGALHELHTEPKEVVLPRYPNECLFRQICDLRELADPNELTFYRLDIDLPHLSTLFSKSIDKVGREVFYLVPTYPLQRASDPPLTVIPEPFRIKDELKCSNYVTLRSVYMCGMDISLRAPLGEDELEFVEVMAFLFVRRYYYQVFLCGKVDPITEMLEPFQPRSKPLTVVDTEELAKRCMHDGIRCEYAPRSTDLDATPPGTTLFLFVDDREVVVVRPDLQAPNKGTVVFALQLFYTDALVGEQSKFRLSVVSRSPSFFLEVGLAFRDRRICQLAAKLVNERSRERRKAACTAVSGLLRVVLKKVAVAPPAAPPQQMDPVKDDGEVKKCDG